MCVIWLGGATLLLIRGEIQPSLDERLLQHGVLFPASHKREARRSQRIAPVPYCPFSRNRACARGEVMGGEVAADGRECPAQFIPVQPVALVAETAKPTFRCEPVRRQCGPLSRLLAVFLLVIRP